MAQLGKFETILTGKHRLFARYREAFDNLEAVQLVETPTHVNSNYWFINILVDDPEALRAYLEERDIGTRRYFYPLHRQPCYQDIADRDCPNSVWLYERGLSLPSSPRLTDADISRVCDGVRGFFAT